MRRRLTRESLDALMAEIARRAPGLREFRVFLVGGATAVHAGWRDSTIDADLHATDEAVFADVQAMKERLRLNIEFARPETFVPPLDGSAERHVFIRKIGRVSFFHYDPYAQLLAKIVRGFARDVEDAGKFLDGGMVDAARFRTLVESIPDSVYAKYPALSREAVLEAVAAFLDARRSA